MQPKKYTTKEINDAAIAARKEAEKVYTTEKVKQMHPIETTAKTVKHDWPTEELPQYDNRLEDVIGMLQRKLAAGATHIDFNWSNAEWAGDELSINFEQKQVESVDEYALRIYHMREKYLNDAYAYKQNEMMKHNDKVKTYLELKKEFGA